MSELSWRHHALIQALLSRGPLIEDDFHAIFLGITNKDSGAHRQQFNDFLLKINKELSYVHFELRGCRNQNDGNVYYGVVNNVSDEQSKLGTKYTVPQLAFYKGIIEAIVQDVSAQGSISDIDALNIRLENQVLTGTESQSQGVPPAVPAAFKNFSISQKEKTLDELTKDQWLSSTPDGKIRLGVRSFLDLRSWFHNNDVPACEVCNEAGIKAELCRNEGCTIRIHLYCLKKKFSQRRGGRVCPGCGTQWQHSSIAEAIGEEDERQKREPPPPPAAATRKRLRSCKAEDGEINGPSSSQICTVPAGSSDDIRRITRKSARLR